MNLGTTSFYANAKLMITSEYLVLDGAPSLAVPLTYGQDLKVSPLKEKILSWKATQPGGTWFEARFSLPELDILSCSDHMVAARLVELLQAARTMNPAFLHEAHGYFVSTHLNFDREWGLGSSSTLIHNISRWAAVDPFKVLKITSKGSGYDIACAEASGPILYRLSEGKPVIKKVNFFPEFSGFIYFVYLGIKQDSNRGIRDYRSIAGLDLQQCAEEAGRITENILNCKGYEEFILLISEHEALLSRVLGRPVLSETLFKGFPGTAKSLGAWGGDFAMLCTQLPIDELKKTLKSIGINVIFKFDDIVLKHGMN